MNWISKEKLFSLFATVERKLTNRKSNAIVLGAALSAAPLVFGAVAPADARSSDDYMIKLLNERELERVTPPTPAATQTALQALARPTSPAQPTIDYLEVRYTLTKYQGVVFAANVRGGQITARAFDSKGGEVSLPADEMQALERLALKADSNQSGTISLEQLTLMVRPNSRQAASPKTTQSSTPAALPISASTAAPARNPAPTASSSNVARPTSPAQPTIDYLEVRYTLTKYQGVVFAANVRGGQITARAFDSKGGEVSLPADEMQALERLALKADSNQSGTIWPEKLASMVHPNPTQVTSPTATQLAAAPGNRQLASIAPSSITDAISDYAMPQASMSQGNDRESQVFFHLTGSLGFTTNAACGVIGNIRTENDQFDPNLFSPGGKYFGIFQHGGPRQVAVQRYAGPPGRASLLGQVDFMANEELPDMDPGYRTSRDNPFTLGQRFGENVEVGAGLDKRGYAAADCYKRFKNFNPTAIASQPPAQPGKRADADNSGQVFGHSVDNHLKSGKLAAAATSTSIQNVAFVVGDSSPSLTAPDHLAQQDNFLNNQAAELAQMQRLVTYLRQSDIPLQLIEQASNLQEVQSLVFANVEGSMSQLRARQAELRKLGKGAKGSAALRKEIKGLQNQVITARKSVGDDLTAWRADQKAAAKLAKAEVTKPQGTPESNVVRLVFSDGFAEANPELVRSIKLPAFRVQRDQLAA